MTRRPALRGLALAVVAAIAASTGLSHSPVAADSADPQSDQNSMKSLTEQVGVVDFWNAGYTGAGVDVAVIDTGVVPVAGLDSPGKIVYGPDLSFESQVPGLAHLDLNGHGTFMAGLIAGHDAALTSPYAAAPATAYRGIAPDARIVSLKVGVADGGVDVSQMIAAINWVVDHRQDAGLNIRVLSLSYGSDSLQPWAIDPLSFAAERAWRAGIVVVVSAGNANRQKGAQAAGLADPAYNPTLLAVGGYDTKGTESTTDDTLGSYSARAAGANARSFDVVAPGNRLQGLRVPGSWIDETHPEGLLDDRYFRGTGTSEAAAVASGMVALVLQQHPELTPDEVKAFLQATSTPISSRRKDGRAAATIDMRALLTAAPKLGVTQTNPPALGTGSLEKSRGSDHVVTNGVELTGERDIFGVLWTPKSAGASWQGGVWNGSVWAGGGWTGSTWDVVAWPSMSWAAVPWGETTWSGSSWSGSSWSGSSWSGSSWSGLSWSGSSWSGSSWSGSSWSGSSWSGSSWSGSTWSGSTWG